MAWLTSEEFLAEAEDRWTEIEFMMDQGLSAEEIARRIGSTPVALSRQAYRYGWPDRARRFNSAAIKGRTRKSRAKAA